MKQYSDLSLRGKLKRLHKLAESAVGCYDLDHPRLEYFAFATNLLYRVSTCSGERFMLRLAYPGWRTREDLQSEALWLEALDRDTTIGVPALLHARSGEYVLPMSSAEVAGTWYAGLMRWLPGRLLGHCLTPINLAKMGELFACLHQHGASWNPPAGFTTRHFEHWLSRGETNLLVGGDQSPLVSSLPASSVRILDQVHLRVEQAYATVDRSDLRIIHCDLWHDNLKLHRGRLYPFDFEDTVWGFRCHDIAMAMLDLLETVGAKRYLGLLAAFRSGYTAHLDWPAEPLEPFQAGRLLWKLNWIARYQPGQLVVSVEGYVPILEHFMMTGEMVIGSR